MRPQVATSVTPTDDDDGIFQLQTLAGSGALTLNGALVTSGIAYAYTSADTTAQAQKVSITGTGNNSGITATIVGTDAGGASLTSTITLANNGTATTTLYYRTVSSVTVSGAVTGNIKGGWVAANGFALREFYLDRQQLPGNVELNVVVVSGTLTLTAQYSATVRDPQVTTSYSGSATWQSVDGLTAITATASSNLAYNVVATRLTCTSWTSGTAIYTATQGNPY